ncbi:unnamed protein product [Effrenium voratum]|nr:unnamed protein product [Effrenium voratum]
MVHRSDARLDLPHDWKVSVVCTFISVDTTECGEEDTECCGVRARRSTSVPPTGTTPEDTEFAQNNDVAKADESVSCATDVLDDEASELSSCGSIPGELNVQDDCSKQRQFECGHSYDEGALPEWFHVLEKRDWYLSDSDEARNKRDATKMRCPGCRPEASCPECRLLPLPR